MKSCRDKGSFRDPAGHVFYRDGVVYRQINPCYLPTYEKLMKSGLYEELLGFGALVPHQETEAGDLKPEDAKLICPQRIPFVSYPYEWCFGQLKDAALLTLKIHRRAMRHGMVLKDASAYNIQFLQGKPLLIDTLSFGDYESGAPWGAYGQFCRHFLAPLLLMTEVDLRMNRLLISFLDGIPLDLAAKLLRGKGGFFARQHIVWHAKSVKGHEGDGKAGTNRAKTIVLSRERHLALIEGLIKGVEKLVLRHTETEWGDYYAHTNYSDMAAGSKGKIVQEFLGETAPGQVWDLGANDGTYSRLALACGACVVAFDIDPVAVERNYHRVKEEPCELLPLILDLTNPSPGIGFGNVERQTIAERQKPDCIMALAILHHLAISNNLPLETLAEWFAQLAPRLIIEFVPKTDSQVQILLATRRDIFPTYTREGFEEAFSNYFAIRAARPVAGSERWLYLLEVRR